MKIKVLNQKNNNEEVPIVYPLVAAVDQEGTLLIYNIETHEITDVDPDFLRPVLCLEVDV